MYSYLENTDDGLPTRRSHDYAKDKLEIVERYVYKFATSMKAKGWNALNYIDLFAGYGKNRFVPSGEVRLGSPLISLTTRYPLSNYFLVELGQSEFAALNERVRASELGGRVRLYNADCNDAVDEIISALNELDLNRGLAKPSLNLAFVDPEGIEEIHWETVEKLARQNRMDLIINFSTSAITRNIRRLSDTERITSIDRFFGTGAWRDIYRNVQFKDKTALRRTLLDLYIDQLSQFDYVNDLRSEEHVFKNRKNRQIYSLIFASKHPLGVKLWNDTLNEVRQPRLL